MTLGRLVLAPLVVALLGASAFAYPAPTSSAAQRVRADVEYLAGDALEGRGTGSRGYEMAAAYVASQFRAIGLKPGGADGQWYLDVPFRQAWHAEAPRAALTIRGRELVLRAQADFAVRPSLTSQARRLAAPLVFVGHGISDSTLGIDDYAGLDLRGKIAVALEGAPPGLSSEVSAHLDSWKQTTAADKGAIGLMEIEGTAPGRGRGLGYYVRPVIDWIDPTGKSTSQSERLQLVGSISRAIGERLFRGARRDLSDAARAGLKPGTVTGFELKSKLTVSDRTRWQDFKSPEVIGLLPGSDPVLKDEYVVLMAHLDHLGIKSGAAKGEDSIYNGALDNAAGVATMLEAAREFVASAKPPRRSVLFIANTGEEKGLRGADYFAAHPTVPAGSIVGLVDLDMPLLLYDFTDVVAYGGDHSTVARTIADAAQSMGVKVSPDPMPEEAIFVRSDHYRFVTRGVPAILLMTGFGNGGERKWKDFLASAYHQPNDDLKQPIRWDQGARYAELNYRIARALADADQRPLWYKGDYFGDTFAPGQPRADHSSAP
ncbi:MAG TPA: M20/M25/M40 family metallo-hydrolase [Sphingomicrobium sp.]|nr:M20/M25/M40 family metallo-hydrolase [Sphingomicrobium sp.]